MSVRLGRVANGWFLVDHYADHLIWSPRSPRFEHWNQFLWFLRFFEFNVSSFRFFSGEVSPKSLSLKVIHQSKVPFVGLCGSKKPSGRRGKNWGINDTRVPWGIGTSRVPSYKLFKPHYGCIYHESQLLSKEVGKQFPSYEWLFTWCNWLWWRVVDPVTIHNVPIHHKPIRSNEIDLEEGW